jgi:hypothetical protein
MMFFNITAEFSHQQYLNIKCSNWGISLIKHYITDTIAYNGTQLSSLWAFRNFSLQGDSIVSFQGPCRVKLAEMVDLEDVKNNAPIYSEKMLHFIIEHFDLDLEKTIVRQRLFIAIIKDTVQQYTGTVLRRDGDDLFHNEKKLSVSIATLTPVSTMIHSALNVISDNVPVPAVGLIDLGLEIDKMPALGADICGLYAKECDEIRMARCKVRGVK